jgi:hypothetical protein
VVIQRHIITVKRSVKHFSEQAFLIDLARVSWKDIDLIPSVDDTWLLFNLLLLPDTQASHLDIWKCKCTTLNANSTR